MNTECLFEGTEQSVTSKNAINAEPGLQIYTAVKSAPISVVTNEPNDNILEVVSVYGNRKRKVPSSNTNKCVSTSKVHISDVAKVVKLLPSKIGENDKLHDKLSTSRNTSKYLVASVLILEVKY